MNGLRSSFPGPRRACRTSLLDLRGAAAKVSLMHRAYDRRTGTSSARGHCGGLCVLRIVSMSVNTVYYLILIKHIITSRTCQLVAQRSRHVHTTHAINIQKRTPFEKRRRSSLWYGQDGKYTAVWFLWVHRNSPVVLVYDTTRQKPIGSWV